MKLLKQLLALWNIVRLQGAPLAGKHEAVAHEKHLRTGYLRDYGHEPSDVALRLMQAGVQYWFEGEF